jgi:hypothetical protein
MNQVFELIDSDSGSVYRGPWLERAASLPELELLAGFGRRPRHDDVGSMRGTHGFSPCAKGGSMVA